MIRTAAIRPSGIGQASPPIHPLTSSQGAVFLINSRQGFFRCDPATAKHWPRKTPNERGTTRKKFIRILSATVCVKSAIFCGQCFALTGRALLLTYGRFFAEFLEEHSLVRLGLLDLTTCVGLRYGLTAPQRVTAAASLQVRILSYHATAKHWPRTNAERTRNDAEKIHTNSFSDCLRHVCDILRSVLCTDILTFGTTLSPDYLRRKIS